VPIAARMIDLITSSTSSVQPMPQLIAALQQNQIRPLSESNRATEVKTSQRAAGGGRFEASDCWLGRSEATQFIEFLASPTVAVLPPSPRLRSSIRLPNSAAIFGTGNLWGWGMGRCMKMQ
jgi:hypothetical protein